MKKALIVVDFQNDFVDGALGFLNANELDLKIVDKILEYRSNNNDIIFTFDTHDENYLLSEEGKNLPIPHCIKGTSGWKLYGNTCKNIKDNDTVFEKPTFGSLELGNYLKDMNYDEVELVGLVTNICILSNAVIAKAALPNAKIIVDSKLVDSFDKELHNKTLDVLKGIHINIK